MDDCHLIEGCGCSTVPQIREDIRRVFQLSGALREVSFVSITLALHGTLILKVDTLLGLC